MDSRSATRMTDSVLADPAQVELLKTEPVKVLRNAEKRAIDGGFINDKWLYRLVISFLGSTVLVVALGTIGLAVRGLQTTPEGLVALGSAAVGALAGLLAPSPTQR